MRHSARFDCVCFVIAVVLPLRRSQTCLSTSLAHLPILLSISLLATDLTTVPQGQRAEAADGVVATFLYALLSQNVVTEFVADWERRKFSASAQRNLANALKYDALLVGASVIEPSALLELIVSVGCGFIVCGC